MMIDPHGGKLINLFLEPDQQEQVLEKLPELPQLVLSERSLSDLELLANGAFSPLTGFMTQRDYQSVINNIHLNNGLAWSLPITLAVSKNMVSAIGNRQKLILLDKQKNPLAILIMEEIFEYDKSQEAERVFGTNDHDHPGVEAIYQQGDFYIGGSLKVLNKPKHLNYLKYRLDPLDTRSEFKKRGLETIVAFQTRNPIHRAHEYLQKCALETADGLHIHPLVGLTKADDFPVDLRMRSYSLLIDKYYSTDRVLFSIFPAYMRYAGPREAIFHAIVRKNYGCSHIIIGRDHAGVKNYYSSYDAQEIFSQFSPDELGITPIFFDNAFYCRTCGNMATKKTCPHDTDAHITMSGTQIREQLKNGILPPPEVTRPEIAQVLMEGLKDKK